MFFAEVLSFKRVCICYVLNKDCLIQCQFLEVLSLSVSLKAGSANGGLNISNIYRPSNLLNISITIQLYDTTIRHHSRHRRRGCYGFARS